jgi:hypothetical protein
MFKELIESIQEKRIKGALHKEGITSEDTENYNKQLSIIKENRGRREELEKLKAETHFQSQVQAIKEQPLNEEKERQAMESFRLRTVSRTGRLPQKQSGGFLGGFDKFLAGTGVAQGTAPVLGRGGVVGGGGRHSMGISSMYGGGFDVIGKGSGPSGFSVAGGYTRPASVAPTRKTRKIKHRKTKHHKIKHHRHSRALTLPQPEPFRII